MASRVSWISVAMLIFLSYWDQGSCQWGPFFQQRPQQRQGYPVTTPPLPYSGYNRYPPLRLGFPAQTALSEKRVDVSQLPPGEETALRESITSSSTHRKTANIGTNVHFTPGIRGLPSTAVGERVITHKESLINSTVEPDTQHTKGSKTKRGENEKTIHDLTEVVPQVESPGLTITKAPSLRPLTMKPVSLIISRQSVGGNVSTELSDMKFDNKAENGADEYKKVSDPLNSTDSLPNKPKDQNGHEVLNVQQVNVDGRVIFSKNNGNNTAVQEDRLSSNNPEVAGPLSIPTDVLSGPGQHFPTRDEEISKKNNSPFSHSPLNKQPVPNYHQNPSRYQNQRPAYPPYNANRRPSPSFPQQNGNQRPNPANLRQSLNIQQQTTLGSDDFKGKYAPVEGNPHYSSQETANSAEKMKFFQHTFPENQANHQESVLNFSHESNIQNQQVSLENNYSQGSGPDSRHPLPWNSKDIRQNPPQTNPVHYPQPVYTRYPSVQLQTTNFHDGTRPHQTGSSPILPHTPLQQNLQGNYNQYQQPHSQQSPPVSPSHSNLPYLRRPLIGYNNYRPLPPHPLLKVGNPTGQKLHQVIGPVLGPAPGALWRPFTEEHPSQTEATTDETLFVSSTNPPDIQSNQDSVFIDSSVRNNTKRQGNRKIDISVHDNGRILSYKSGGLNSLHNGFQENNKPRVFMNSSTSLLKSASHNTEREDDVNFKSHHEVLPQFSPASGLHFILEKDTHKNNNQNVKNFVLDAKNTEIKGDNKLKITEGGLNTIGTFTNGSVVQLVNGNLFDDNKDNIDDSLNLDKTTNFSRDIDDKALHAAQNPWNDSSLSVTVSPPLLSTIDSLFSTASTDSQFSGLLSLSSSDSLSRSPPTESSIALTSPYSRDGVTRTDKNSLSPNNGGNQQKTELLLLGALGPMKPVSLEIPDERKKVHLNESLVLGNTPIEGFQIPEEEEVHFLSMVPFFQNVVPPKQNKTATDNDKQDLNEKPNVSPATPLGSVDSKTIVKIIAETGGDVSRVSPPQKGAFKDIATTIFSTESIHYPDYSWQPVTKQQIPEAGVNLQSNHTTDSPILNSQDAELHKRNPLHDEAPLKPSPFINEKKDSTGMISLIDVDATSSRESETAAQTHQKDYVPYRWQQRYHSRSPIPIKPTMMPSQIGESFAEESLPLPLTMEDNATQIHSEGDLSTESTAVDLSKVAENDHEQSLTAGESTELVESPNTSENDQIRLILHGLPKSLRASVTIDKRILDIGARPVISTGYGNVVYQV
ncbi:uncharacterized protein LOC135217972 isoform X2 [Macrobrachium nipponense]|uniref:uncharacterized protein LOC135217972 isoform X2 n=1 Tax=Macrobrachium nipponense TaxID=159736 RepID=UPI0030C7C495